MKQRADIALDHVSKSFAASNAVDDVSFRVEDGTFLVLLGPSGCGKSTTLRMIAGLEPVTSGRILIGGRDVTHEPSAKRGIAMVFQNYALFPHMSVRDNILFGLSVRKVPQAEQKKRLERAVDLLALGPYLARKPGQLSGGQQQRVALGRAIVAEAPVCLMDEPLSNLDAKLRAEMRREIRALQRRLGITMIYVTHDQIEAMTMADHIVLMKDGRIEQEGTPEDLYRRPATTFAASFIGTPPMNVLPLNVLRHGAEDCLAGIRPENLAIDGSGVSARIVSAEYLGADTLVEADLAGHTVLVRVAGQFALGTGDEIRLRADTDHIHRFDRASGRRIAS